MPWSSLTLSPVQIAAGEDDRIRDLFTEEWRERAMVRDMALFSTAAGGSIMLYFSPDVQVRVPSLLRAVGAQPCQAPPPDAALYVGFPGTRIAPDGSGLLKAKRAPRAKPEKVITPGTLIDGARMYAASADAVNDILPNAYHVQSHLLGMSIELALKAYLRSHGWKISQLQELGHNLTKLYNRACKIGLSDTGSRHFTLFVAGHNYQSKLFAYPQTAVFSSIMPWRLRQICAGIVREVFKQIKGQQVFDEMSAKPGLAIQGEYSRDVNPSAWAESEVAAGSPELETSSR
jgi:hypothetical protein